MTKQEAVYHALRLYRHQFDTPSALHDCLNEIRGNAAAEHRPPRMTYSEVWQAVWELVERGGGTDG